MQRNTVFAAAALVVAGIAMPAGAFAAEGSVNILDYALSHPVDNARMKNPPSLGDSVPAHVSLQKPDADRSTFGYFYFDGKPVIVDMKTRSVVRVDK